MASYPLLLVTYDRGLHWQSQKPKPYHWAFFIKTESVGYEVLGTVHQLRGMPGAFYYGGPEQGEVESEKMDKVTEKLRAIPIEKNEASSRNCQGWSLAALDVLRKEGFIDDQYTNEVIKNWLREDE
ncbi:MAG: hypothetical protein Q9163_000356 [Psora crenata]